MFNRLALYFIFSPSCTHPSSFFSLFPPTYSLTHTHCLNTLSSLRISSLSGKEMGLNFLSFLHIWRGALDTGAVVEWRRESCCDVLLNVSESAEWQPFELKHFNDAFVLPGRGNGKKEWERKVALCSGVLANPALMPPGLHILSLTVLQWAELSFRPAGNEVSGYFSSARSPPYHHSSGDYVALAMRPLGCNVV